MGDAKEEIKEEDDHDLFIDSFDEPTWDQQANKAPGEVKEEAAGPAPAPEAPAAEAPAPEEKVPPKVEIKRVESFQSTDSFDEPVGKGDPIDMEPMFSTASGVRIDVKPESIDKSRKMLTTTDSTKTPSSSSKRSNFTSPFIRKPPTDGSSKQFVSPFRRDQPSTSTKRVATSPRKDAPPAKKSATSGESSERSGSSRHSSRNSSQGSRPSSRVSTVSKKERKELHADVLRISRVFEKDQYRLILQESTTSPRFLGIISSRRGSHIKFGDRLEFDAEILKKDDSTNQICEVYIEKILKNRKNGAHKDAQRHSIADAPFCLKPKFIHELRDNPAIRKTVISINILDLKIEIYEGCSKDRYQIEKKDDKKYCPKCKSYRVTGQAMVYCRLRVADFSGQVFLNMLSKVSEKFLEILGYEGVAEWYKFQDPNERHSYVFKPMLLEIEKDRKEEWEVTDVAEVNWAPMANYLERIVKNECN